MDGCVCSEIYFGRSGLCPFGSQTTPGLIRRALFTVDCQWVDRLPSLSESLFSYC
jgi:hypothetical protein